MKKRQEPRNVFFRIVTKKENGIQEINDLNCGIFSMEEKKRENIFEFFQSATGQN